MTNKEAAKIIEMLFHDSTNEDYPFTEEFGKACELAIEALMESEKYKRMILLLEKCLELFRKEEECPYLINILAETIYKANQEAINSIKLQLRLIEGQINREWGQSNG